MPTTDPRIDAYIDRAAPFAQPILAHLRAAVHAACPDVQETIKWGMPFFMHGERILGNMAGFKQHSSFGLWKGRGLAPEREPGEGMGHFGRIATLKDLPPKRELVQIIRKAVAAIDAGSASPPAPKARVEKRAPPGLPPALAEALKRNEVARQVFDGFSPSQRFEYIEWIAEAKRPETSARRVAQAIEWLGEGKTRHWQYRKA